MMQTGKAIVRFGLSAEAHGITEARFLSRSAETALFPAAEKEKAHQPTNPAYVPTNTNRFRPLLRKPYRYRILTKPNRGGGMANMADFSFLRQFRYFFNFILSYVFFFRNTGFLIF